MKTLVGTWRGVVVAILLSGCTPKPEFFVENAFVKAPGPTQEEIPVSLRLVNHSDTGHRLTFAESSVASHIERRKTTYRNGVRQAQPINKIYVAPRAELTLHRDGTHLLLQGVYDNLEPGMQFDLRLEFDSGEVLHTQVGVRSR